MKTNTGTSKKKSESVTALLSIVLSKEITLYSKTRKFHWNVSGENIMEMHRLFQAHYQLLEKSIKEVSEQINKLGCRTNFIMKEYYPHINDTLENYPTSKEMIKELLADHETAIVHLREDIDKITKKYKDSDTAYSLICRKEAHETIARALESVALSLSLSPTSFYN